MTKRAARAYKSVWERRGPRWLAALGAALILAVVVGAVGGSRSSAAMRPYCTPTGPNNTAPGVLSPTSTSGTTGISLQTTKGSWSSVCVPITGYFYRFLHGSTGIDPAGGGWASWPGSNPTHTTGSADRGYKVTAAVEACDSTDCIWVQSTGSYYVQPANTTAPTISPSGTGQSYTTHPFSTTNGTWSSAAANTGYNYQWLRNGSPISGATSSNYTPSTSDCGTTLTSEVQYKTADGTSGWAVSSNNAKFVPCNTTAPSMSPSGSGQDPHGTVFTADHGAWAGSPTSYTYKWSEGSTQVGSGSTYTASCSTDAGQTLTLQVEATNANGTSAWVASSNSTNFQGCAPMAGSAAIDGEVQSGQTLTATPSDFDLGNPTATYSYQWEYSDSADGAYATIDGATSSTYVVDPVYVDEYLEVVITATNDCSSGCGSASATSAPSDPVAHAFGTACYAQDATALRCNVSADLNAAPSVVYTAYAASATDAVWTEGQTVTPGTPFTVNLPGAEPDWDVYVSWQDPDCEPDCAGSESDLGGADIGDVVIDTTIADFPTGIVGVADPEPLFPTWEAGPTGEDVGPTGDVGQSGASEGRGSAGSAGETSTCGTRATNFVGTDPATNNGTVYAVTARINTEIPHLCGAPDTGSRNGSASAVWTMLQGSGPGDGYAQSGYEKSTNNFGDGKSRSVTYYFAEAIRLHCSTCKDAFKETSAVSGTNEYHQSYDFANNVIDMEINSTVLLKTKWDPKNNWTSPWMPEWEGETHWTKDDVPGTASSPVYFSNMRIKKCKTCAWSWATLTASSTSSRYAYKWDTQNGKFHIWTK